MKPLSTIVLFMMPILSITIDYCVIHLSCLSPSPLPRLVATLQIHDTYFLVAIIDNEYIDSTLFELLLKVLEHHRTEEAPPEAVDEWF